MTDLDIFLAMIKKTIPPHADKKNYFITEELSNARGILVEIYGADDQEMDFYFDNNGNFCFYN